MRVCVDPGHGGPDRGASAAGDRHEKDSNLRCALLLRPQLEEMDAGVLLTRSDDEDLSLTERARLANSWNADMFISLHADWAPNSAAMGHHAIHSVYSSPEQGSNRLARFLVDHLTKMTGRDPWPRGDRGIWSRWNSSGDADCYGVIRGTRMPAVIVERGFLSNAEDADLLFDESFLKMQAEAIAAAVSASFGMPKVTPIVGQPELSALQAVRWARDNGAHERFTDVADEYWLLATRIGIRSELAYAQSARETGFGHTAALCGLSRTIGPASRLRTPQEIVLRITRVLTLPERAFAPTTTTSLPMLAWNRWVNPIRGTIW